MERPMRGPSIAWKVDWRDGEAKAISPRIAPNERTVQMYARQM
jgi:hypothetical protein